MKKYILFAFFLFSVLTLLFATTPAFMENKSYAANTWNSCTCKDELNSGDITCPGKTTAKCKDANAVCRNSPDLQKMNPNYNEIGYDNDFYKGVRCVPKTNVTTCRCTQPNVSGTDNYDDKNGFKCINPANGQEIVSEMFCAEGNQKCVTDNTKSIYLNDVQYQTTIFKGESKRFFNGYIGKGIACMTNAEVRADTQKQQANQLQTDACHCDTADGTGLTFWCDKMPAGTRLTCGSDKVRCAPTNNTDNTVFPLTNVHLIKNQNYSTNPDYTSYITKYRAQGISCEAKDEAEEKAEANLVVKCACNGKNSFQCEGQGLHDNRAYNIYCKNPLHMCVDGPDKTVLLDDDEGDVKVEGRNGAWNMHVKGKTAKGVTCERPTISCQCKHPGQNGVKINGFTCGFNNNAVKLKDTDYCPDANQACIDIRYCTNIKQSPSGSPASKEATAACGTMTPEFQYDKGTENHIFKSARLQGINCVEVPAISPPGPPCAGGFDEAGRCLGFASAFGLINTNAGDFIASIFKLLLSISGGIALLLIMRAGYQIMVSGGKPDQINAGREQLIAAIVGLLFIIFSMVILQVIGVDILRLPGFGGPGSTPTTGSPGTAGNLNGSCDMTVGTSCNTGLNCVSTNGGRNGTCQPE